MVAAAWRRAWNRVIPFFAFPPALRGVIYTTNSIESIYSQLRNITADWSRAAHNWKGGDGPIRHPLCRSIYQDGRVV
jgi:transposase-like protein